jgi:hypothetical protein
VLRDYLPATIVTLSLDCLLAGLDFSCLAALSCLQQLCLRQFPSHHASAMEAVGACTGLLRLRLDSRQATPGLREVQVRSTGRLQQQHVLLHHCDATAAMLRPEHTAVSCLPGCPAWPTSPCTASKACMLWVLAASRSAHTRIVCMPPVLGEH